MYMKPKPFALRTSAVSRKVGVLFVCFSWGIKCHERDNFFGKSTSPSWRRAPRLVPFLKKH